MAFPPQSAVPARPDGVLCVVYRSIGLLLPHVQNALCVVSCRCGRGMLGVSSGHRSDDVPVLGLRCSRRASIGMPTGSTLDFSCGFVVLCFVLPLILGVISMWAERYW